jgi:hypothetical protein
MWGELAPPRPPRERRSGARPRARWKATRVRRGRGRTRRPRPRTAGWRPAAAARRHGVAALALLHGQHPAQAGRRPGRLAEQPGSPHGGDPDRRPPVGRLHHPARAQVHADAGPGRTAPPPPPATRRRLRPPLPDPGPPGDQRHDQSGQRQPPQRIGTPAGSGADGGAGRRHAAALLLERSRPAPVPEPPRMSTGPRARRGDNPLRRTRWGLWTTLGTRPGGRLPSRKGPQ